MTSWKRFEELRPDELAAVTGKAPVAFWPLGLLEHHGWHLPVGFDGIKADRICIRIAERTGGVILPVMWWGGGGGHGDFLWTFYQSEEAAERILADTSRKLVRFGFRVVVLLAGHYPWQRLLDRQLPQIEKEYPNVLFLRGTEVSIAKHLQLRGDHAAKEETSFGLALLPEFVDMTALRSGRGKEAWPQGQEIPQSQQYPRLSYDPNDPLFAQLGEDARSASAEHGNAGIEPLVGYLSGAILKFLKDGEKPVKP